MTADAPRRGASGRLPVLYPTWLALAWVATLFVTSGASIWAAVRMLAVTAILVTIACAVAARVAGDRDRGAMIALALVALVLVAQTAIQLWLVAAWIGVVLLDGRLDPGRRSSPWPRITFVASRITAIVVLAVALRAIQQGTIGSVAHDVVAESPLRAVALPAPVSDAPDMYLILLDGYARADKLRTLFGHDNARFLDALEARGFSVAPRSRSNYLATELTLSSMLNGTLLDPSSGDERLDRVVRLRRLVNDAVAWSFLRDRGYENVAIGAGFESVMPRGVDRFIDTGQMNELEVVALTATSIGRLGVAAEFVADQHRARVLGVLDAAADVASEAPERPRFVLAHVPSPHVPVVFDAAGRDVSPASTIKLYDEVAVAQDIGRAAYGSAYIGQLIHLNTLVLDTVDRILASSREPPVIVLFSDHGSAAGLDWAHLESSDLDERTANLFAALTPGRPGLFGDHPTPVNLVTTLLNAYVGGDFPAQPDVQFRLLDEDLNFARVEVGT